jgi:hypothetical protein
VDSPVLSKDGTHIALHYSEFSGAMGLVIKTVGQSAVTSSDIIVSDEYGPALVNPVAVSDDGSTLVYTDPNSPEESIKIYKNGSTLTAPSLDYTYADSESLTADGSTLVYTLASDQAIFPQEAYYDNYPGVYKWQIP